MKAKFNIIALVVAFLVGVVGTFIVTFFLVTIPPLIEFTTGRESGDMAEIQEVYSLIRHNYLLEVDSEELITGAINGMVETLGDPFTSYMSSEDAEQLNQSLGSSFYGIGVEVNMVDGYFTVVSPMRNAPAERAGIRTNDVIVSVDGVSLEGLSQAEAVSKVRGEQGTIVTLEVRRIGVSNLLTFEVERDEIPIITVFGEVKEENGKQIGYLQITSFSQNTAEEFERELAELESQNIEGLVIDVRGNGGGYLGSVEEIASLLVTDEKPVVQIEGRDGVRSTFISTLTERKAYPISVLIDEGSASASEILAVALKEIGNYEVVGVSSFGKGTVQTSVPLANGSSLHLTQAKWLTPAGNWINEVGVEPTIEVEQPEFFFVSPIQFETELKFDMSSEQVAKAQLMLQGLGFNPDRQDGFFSRATENAVREFQQENDLAVTGTINEETVAALHEGLIEEIRNPENDLQLKRALEVVAE